MDSYGDRTKNYPEIDHKEKITLFADIHDKIPEEINDLISISEVIFNTTDETLMETLDALEKYNKNPICLVSIIETALRIRPKQVNALAQLMCTFIYRHTYGKGEVCNVPVINFLRERNVRYFDDGFTEEEMEEIKKKIDKTEIKDLYPEGSVEQAIYDDNVDAFVSLTAQASFDILGEAKCSEKFPIANPSYNVFDHPLDKIPYLSFMALCGSVKCFKYCLMEGGYDERGVEKFAIAGGNVEIIHLLEQKGLSFDFCLDVAVSFHRDLIADWLINHYRCSEISLYRAGASLNYKAFFVGLVNHKEKLTKEELQLALFGAVRSHSVDLLKYVVEELKVNPNEIRNSDKMTALHLAVKVSDSSIIDYLIENGMNPEEKGFEGVTPTAYAAWLGDEEMICFLMDMHDTDPNKKDSMGYTVLDYACRGGNTSAISFLVDVHDLPLDQPHKVKQWSDKIVVTSLSVAAQYDKFEAIKFINEKYNVDFNAGEKTPLHYACESPDFEIAKYLIEECNANVEQFSGFEEGDRTPIHYATNSDDVELVRYLVDKCNCDVSCTTNSRYSKSVPIYNCVANNNFEMVKIIGDKYHGNIEEDCYSEDYYDTPLHCAIENGNRRIVEYFVKECNAGISSDDIKDASNNRIKKILMDAVKLNIVCKKGELELVKKLVEKKNASITRMFNGKSPLYYAVMNNHPDIVRYFIEECNIDIDIDYMEYAKNPEIIEIIKPCFQLLEACKEGDLETVKKLVNEKNLSIQRNVVSSNAMLAAISANRLNIVKFFIEEKNEKIREISGRDICNILENKGSKMFRYIYPNISPESLTEKLKISILNKAADEEDMETLLFMIPKVDKELLAKEYINMHNKDTTGELANMFATLGKEGERGKMGQIALLKMLTGMQP